MTLRGKVCEQCGTKAVFRTEREHYFCTDCMNRMVNTRGNMEGTEKALQVDDAKHEADDFRKGGGRLS